MRFEQALQAMREGKKARYNEEIYFIDEDDDFSLRRFQTDVDGILDTETSWYACLYGDDILSEDWEIEEDEPQS